MLREATIDDLDAIKSLAYFWLEESGEDLSFSDQGFLEAFLHNIADPDVYLYVIEYEDIVVGLGVLSIRNLLFQEKIARLEWFYVHRGAYNYCRYDFYTPCACF